MGISVIMPGYSSSSETSSEAGNETSSSSEHPLIEANQESGEEWEVDYIEDTRIVGDQRQYLIKYKGYEPSEWHGETAVGNSEILVEAFLKSYGRFGSQRSDWIAEQIKAVDEAPEGDEEPEEEPQASSSKVQEGLIIEFPIKKRKKKKKKKPKEHPVERVNSDFADSSSSSSASSTSSISSSEESYRSVQDPEDKDYMSNYVPKMLELRQSMELINLGWKKVKLEEMKAILSSQQVQQYMYFNDNFDHPTCDKNLQIEDNKPIDSPNHSQLNQAESSKRNDQVKVKGKGKAKTNGKGKERTQDKGKGKENGNGIDRTKGKGKGKGKERAREDDDEDQDQDSNQVEKLSPVVEEQESEDEAEVNNKRLKRKTTSGNLGEVKRKCLRRISTQT